MLDPISVAQEWATNLHTHVASFAVCRVVSERRYVHGEYPTLEEARNAARLLGGTVLGHRAVIFALTPEGWARELERIDLE